MAISLPTREPPNLDFDATADADPASRAHRSPRPVLAPGQWQQALQAPADAPASS